MIEEYIKQLIYGCLTNSIGEEKEEEAVLINLNDTSNIKDNVASNPEYSILQSQRDELRNLLREKEEMLAYNVENLKRLLKENAQFNKHISILQTSFDDLSTKYEKIKSSLLILQQNKQTRLDHIKCSEEALKKLKEKYPALLSHINMELTRANEEALKVRRNNEADLKKYITLVKGMELKCNGVMEELRQKTEAFDSLKALFDDMSNKLKK